MARVDLRENGYMERFVGQDHVDSNDIQFWYQLLSCSFNFMRVQDPRIVEKTLDPYLVRLTLNNKQSLNIGSLIRVFIDRVSRIKSPSGESTNSYYVFQSFNALYLIRCVCKSYIENLSEEQLVKSMRARIDKANPQISQKPLPAVSPVLSTASPQHQQIQQLSQPPNQSQSFPQQQQQPSSTPILPPPPQPPHQVAPEHHEKDHHQQQQPPVQSQVQQDQQLSHSSPPTVNEGQLTDSVARTQEVGSNVTSDQDSNKKVEITPGTSMMDTFISVLIEIIVDIPLNDSTYLLKVEAINSLLVLLSVQMYSTTPANQSVIYKCLMQKRCSIHALVLTKTLLINFVSQKPVPHETGSIIIGIASGLWKVLTLGYGSGQEEDESESIPLLARQSLLLLNILTNHHTAEKNPYREAIVSCQDSRFNLSDPQNAINNANNDAMATATTSKSTLMSNSIKIDFHDLYETICKYLNNDQVALLLYLLLHRNRIFSSYILTTASTELDRLLLPLLKILYTSIEKGSHHVYMVLIIFVILSEESPFNEAIHRIIVHGVPWYKDRVLSEISLGSLTVLMIIRSFQFNTFRIKDKFIHTNLFAILANLSNHFHNLHPYVCQRLIDLLERLSKRYLMSTKPPSSKDQPDNQNIPNQTLQMLSSNNPLARALATDTQRQDLQDASSIELDSTTIPLNHGTHNIQNGTVAAAINISIPEDQHNSKAEENKVVLPAVDSHGPAYSSSEKSGQQSPNSSTTDHINISMDDAKQDISLIEEVIRMILEVINNSLARKLKSNSDLIYTLLYKRRVFNNLLSSHQSFYNTVINVERILTFFYNKIESFDRSMSVEEIKDLIQTTSLDWNHDQYRDPNARFRYKYVEDEQPEEFFIPYIWTRIYYSSGIVWNSKRIVLFNPEDL